jgi:mRNA interferase HigB
MNVIFRRSLIDFWGKNPKTKASLQHWLNVTKAVDWKSTQSIVETFPKAKALNNERVRFEIACNNRFIVAFDFRRQLALIKFIGTREQYDNVAVKTVSIF